MIKASEIRIGSYVYGYKTVWCIDYTDFREVYDTDTCSLVGYEPIPITEEYLFKFGFKKETPKLSGQDMWAGMPAWSIGENKWIFRGQATRLHLSGYFNTQVQYVHQLQNLYFTLTGEELTLQNENNNS